MERKWIKSFAVDFEPMANALCVCAKCVSPLFGDHVEWLRRSRHFGMEFSFWIELRCGASGEIEWIAATKRKHTIK